MGDFWKLLSHLKDFKLLLFFAIFSIIVMSVFTIISIPLIIPFFQLLFDRLPEIEPVNEGLYKSWDIGQYLKNYFAKLIHTQGKREALKWVCISIIIVFFLKNLFRYLSMFFLAPIRNGIIYKIRNQVFEKYLYLPLAIINAEKKGDLVSRITNDIQEIEYSILNVLDAVFKAPILIIGSIAFMFYLSVKLTFFTFILLTFTIVVIGWVSKRLKQQSSAVQSHLAQINTIVEESLSGIKVIKSYNAEEFQKQKFDNQNDLYKTQLNKLLWRRDLSSPLSEFLGVSVVAVLLWYGSFLVFDNDLNPGTFFAFVFAFYNVIEPAKSFSAAYYNIQKGMAASERINEILDLGKIEDKSEGVFRTSFTDKIEFKNVSFWYNEQEQILKNINLSIKKGEKIAIVGPSGSGKTTLVDLLPRFYTNRSGQIFIDDVSINDINLSNLRGLIAIVTQDTFLFNDSVSKNIQLNQNVSPQEIEAAAKSANAYDFIKQFSNDFRENIGDRGVRLSGGEKQRLSIARALLLDAPILILDEATSSLDAASEHLVQSAIDKLIEHKTAIIIAHRMSTIKNADRILVLKEGQIIAEGTHSDLLQKSALYKQFVSMQSF